MRKTTISLALIITLMFNMISVNAVSANNYPESKHNYSSNFKNDWVYFHPDETDYLFVTFSEDTYFGPGGEEYYNEESYEYDCDFLTIISEYESFDEIFFADELAGKTIIVPGNKFMITLSTDSKDNYYGFRITDISARGSLGDNVCIKYKISEGYDDIQISKLNENNEFPISYEYRNQIYNDKAIIGWKDDNGHEYIYKNRSFTKMYDEEYDYYYYYYDYEEVSEYTNVFELKPGDEITLTPVYTSVSITPDETFFFSNDSHFFRLGYKMTFAHARRLGECYKSATRNNQFGVIGVPLGSLLPWIYQIVPWRGSCCGFPIAILMQHYGMIDLCANQNASSVSGIMPDYKTTSALNFYNAVTPAAVVCANKAPEPGTDEYKTQIKNLYETVSAGKPVVCFIRCGYINGISYDNPFSIMKGILSKGIRYLVTSFFHTHCILLTGAYTDGDGSRIFIGYDENDMTYCYGNPQIYTVRGDFEDICNEYGSSLGDIAWLSDPSFLASFKADEETDPSAWYSYYKLHKESL